MAFPLPQLCAIFLASAFAAPSAPDAFADMSRTIKEAARKAGFNNLTVDAFRPLGDADAADGPVLSERLATRLTQEGINVVDRKRLSELRDPRSRPLPDRLDLEREGALLTKVLRQLREVDAGGAYEPEVWEHRGNLERDLVERVRDIWHQKELLHFNEDKNPFGVEAVVTGTFTALKDGRLEVHARLMLPATATVLGAATAVVPRDWGAPPRRPPPFPWAEAGVGAVAGLLGLWFAARSALA